MNSAGGLLIIEWSNKAMGVDRIPVAWLSKGKCEGEHEVLKRSRPTWVRCAVTSTGKLTTLDYTRHAKNQKGDDKPGWMRITINDTNDLDACTVEWKDQGANYRPYDADIWHCPDGIDPVDLELPSGSIEGKRTLRNHLVPERDRRLVQNKLNEARREHLGSLKCEVCTIDFNKIFPKLGIHAMEVHHEVRMNSGERLTELSHLRVLCGNCHGLIHKTSPMMSVDELRSLFRHPCHDNERDG